MKKTGLVISLLLLTLAGHSQETIGKYVSEIARGSVLSSAVWGVEARKLSGDEVVSIHSSTRMMPASNMKLVTTGTALHALGGDFSFSTTLACGGEVVDGVLQGDLYILGGGDPTIATADRIAFPLDTTFARWKSILDAAGIVKINGKVIGDGRWLDAERHGLWWTWDDLGWEYGAPMSGLSFYHNSQRFNAVPASFVGGPVKVEVVYPKTPWMEYAHEAMTSEKGSGDNLWYQNTPLSHTAAIKGTLAIDRGARTEKCANMFPELTCASYFHDYLLSCGIESLGYSDEPLLPVDDLNPIGSSPSPSLREIIWQCNHDSDNLYAEMALRVQGKMATGSACYDSCYVAEQEVLNDLGVDWSGVRQKDGSGLSRYNYITPSFLVDFLVAMADSPAFSDFLSSLPQPGSFGTVQSRVPQADAATRERIYMKSGSMDGVRCYSGYILPSDDERRQDTIVFSIMANNLTATSSAVNAVLDRLIYLLSREN